MSKKKLQQDSLSERAELFIAAATLGAHANAKVSFRQRDVRFLIELFSNWVECSLPTQSLVMQNTQIARYLEKLLDEGWLRRIARQGHPNYRLTRTGLIELTSRIVNRSYIHTKEHFFFLFYFIKNYKPRIIALVEQEGRLFPDSLRIELDALLDHKALLQRELENVECELQKLRTRIHDTEKTALLIESMDKKQQSLEEVIAQAQKLYPYELNSQKPLTELMHSIPEDFRKWELGVGNRCRLREIWQPSLELLEKYLKCLEGLVSQV